MLFGYPVAATTENWLHDCVCEAVRSIHAAIDARRRYPAWPAVIPKAYQARLSKKRGLRDRLRSYDRAVRPLAKETRDEILQALEGENRIAELLTGASDCVMLEGLPEEIREPVSELFDFAFRLLTDLDLRDQHYAAIYKSSTHHACPFCGTEYFDAPGAPREALDHFLAKSRYPFAAANLRNLVPMGDKCNSKYKLAVDILRRADGTRRVAFDPYNHTFVEVSLDASSPFGGATDNTPAWEIQFLPDTPAALTWDEVFSVRQRYKRDHLDPLFSGWLTLFGKWVRIANLPIETDADIVAALERYEGFWVESGMNDRAFLKAGVFRMLRRHCAQGDQRLLAQLRDLVSPIAA